MAVEITQLIDIFDRLKDEVHWSHGVVSLIAEDEHAEDVIRESADCAARHLQEALSALCDLPGLAGILSGFRVNNQALVFPHV